MISGNVERLLQEIYSDTRVSPSEIIDLRNAADEAADRVLAQEGNEGVIDALCKSFDVTNQLVQETAIRLKKGTYSDLGKTMVMSLIESHTALLKATVNALK